MGKKLSVFVIMLVFFFAETSYSLNLRAPSGVIRPERKNEVKFKALIAITAGSPLSQKEAKGLLDRTEGKTKVLILDKERVTFQEIKASNLPVGVVDFYDIYELMPGKIIDDYPGYRYFLVANPLLKIQSWLANNTGLPFLNAIDIFKSKRMVFSSIHRGINNSSEGSKVSTYFEGLEKETVHFRRGVRIIRSRGSIGSYGKRIFFAPTAINRVYLSIIPTDILAYLQAEEGVKTYSPTIPYGFQKDSDFSDTDNIVMSIRELFFKRPTLAKIDSQDIGKYLRSIGIDAPCSERLKRAISKRLERLSVKRPETIAVIKEKALELLEIDELNFRKAVMPFIGDYIAVRDLIKNAGVADGSIKFYNLFDSIVKDLLEKEVISRERVNEYSDIIGALTFKAKNAEYELEIRIIPPSLVRYLLAARNGV